MKPSDPPCIPKAVRSFMDNVLTHLEAFAREQGFTIAPYQGADNASILWCHNYCGTIAGHNVTLQVWTDIQRAVDNAGFIQLLICVGNGEHAEWMPLDERCVEGMHELIRETQRGLERLRQACALAMPAPGKRHPVA